MRLLLFALALLPVPCTAMADRLPATSHLTCTSDADCTIARAPCGEKRPVNLRNFPRLQAEWNKTAALVECARDEGADQPALKPLCGQENLCIVIPDIGAN